jgi:hypothetical protein
MNIRSSENSGLITLSLLVDGKQESGHIHPFALCDMPEVNANRAPETELAEPVIYPEEPTGETDEADEADEADYDVPNDVPRNEAPLVLEEPNLESGYLRLHWQGFMPLRENSHISLRIESTHAGVLHMDAGRHTFINVMLVEPLTEVSFPVIETPQPAYIPSMTASYGPLPQIY